MEANQNLMIILDRDMAQRHAQALTLGLQVIPPPRTNACVRIAIEGTANVYIHDLATIISHYAPDDLRIEVRSNDFRFLPYTADIGPVADAIRSYSPGISRLELDFDATEIDMEPFGRSIAQGRYPNLEEVSLSSKADTVTVSLLSGIVAGDIKEVLQRHCPCPEDSCHDNKIALAIQQPGAEVTTTFNIYHNNRDTQAELLLPFLQKVDMKMFITDHTIDYQSLVDYISRWHNLTTIQIQGARTLDLLDTNLSSLTEHLRPKKTLKDLSLFAFCFQEHHLLAFTSIIGEKKFFSPESVGLSLSPRVGAQVIAECLRGIPDVRKLHLNFSERAAWHNDASEKRLIVDAIETSNFDLTEFVANVGTSVSIFDHKERSMMKFCLSLNEAPGRKSFFARNASMEKKVRYLYRWRRDQSALFLFLKQQPELFPISHNHGGLGSKRGRPQVFNYAEQIESTNMDIVILVSRRPSRCFLLVHRSLFLPRCHSCISLIFNLNLSLIELQ